MSTAAKAGKGLLMQIDTTGAGVFATIGEVLSVSGPKESMTLIEATSFDSTYDEAIPSLVKPGDVTINMSWICTDAQQQQARTDFRAGTRRQFKITPNDQATKTTIVFYAYIKEIGPEFPGPKDSIKQSVTLQLDSLPTFTYGHA